MSKIKNASYIIIVVILIFMAGGIILSCFLNKKEPVIISQEEDIKNEEVQKEINQDENNEITYKTFSSPNADFEFEYPSDWVYDEEEVSTIYNGKEIKTMAWEFYPNLKDNYRNKPPYLAVVSPTPETVDFFSFGYKGTKFPYQLNTFPTNDPETYVTYEQGESGGKAYIYWQKGEAFANAYCIDNIYFKVNLMIFHGSDELKGEKVAQHIAQSIKIK